MEHRGRTLRGGAGVTALRARRRRACVRRIASRRPSSCASGGFPSIPRRTPGPPASRMWGIARHW